MRLRTLILILVAAGCGLVAAVLVSQYVGGGSSQAAPVAEKVNVLFAKQLVPGFTPIEKPEDYFELREVPRDEVRDGVSDLEKVKGRSLRVPLSKGKPLAETDMFGVNEIASITQRLKPGERPMSVKVTPLTGTAGFIRPGDRVDVVASSRVRGTEGVMAKTILQDIEVLAIDQSVQSAGSEVARQADLVTLRVSLKEVELLAAFSEGCTLRLVPRRNDDTTKEYSPGTIADISNKAPTGPVREQPKEEEPKVVKQEPPKPLEPGVRRPAAQGVATTEIIIGIERRVQKVPIGEPEKP